jgi:hypothetical protein
MIPHFIENFLTVGDKVVSLGRWPAFTPQEYS